MRGQTTFQHLTTRLRCSAAVACGVVPSDHLHLLVYVVAERKLTGPAFAAQVGDMSFKGRSSTAASSCAWCEHADCLALM